MKPAPPSGELQPVPCVRAARDTDLAAVRTLLAACHLPLDGLEDHFPGGYAVIDEDGSVAAVAGIETHGNAGLLRSLAVDPSRRGGGLGAALVRERLAWAHARGLDSVFLLTTTADDWFPRFGFARVRREDLPNSLGASRELRISPCAGATAMALRIGA